MRVAPGQGTRLDRPRQASMQLRRALSDPELRRHQTVSRVGFTDWGQAFDSAILNRQAVYDDHSNVWNRRIEGLTPVLTRTGSAGRLRLSPPMREPWRSPGRNQSGNSCKSAFASWN